ncbi:hypothetical protein N0V88_003481 [Collariella sp. IMI 366227]|nr:hypothetical protein N0V88_003481 [Collariella sp. IMI 366227]
MTKSTTEFFWPMGPRDSEARIPFPKLTSDSASTIISPLTLPRGVSGYFDHVSSPGNAPNHSASAGHPRSTSADATSAPSHVQMMQRLAQQNARMREAWEAERKYLEANRERAEEVYKEERALMEEERAEWEDEKAQLLDEINWLKLQVLTMGVGPQQVAKGIHPLSRTFSSQCHVRGGTGELTRSNTQSSESSQGTAQPITQGDKSKISPNNPGGAPKIFGNGSSAPTSDFLKPAAEFEADKGPVEIIDIKEINPTLEGVPLKATTVKKATFTDAEPPREPKTSSPSGSPLSGSQESKEKKKAQTMQVLAAQAVDRLTMHAGHTPSHSLSSLATVAASSGTATMGSNGGDSTPTMPHRDDAPSHDIAPSGEGEHHSEATHSNQASPKTTGDHYQPTDDHPEAVYEPGEDRPLKGPLMVRNMPAHDEAFFAKLNEKLEEVRKDDNAALPAVLKGADQAEETERPVEPPHTEVGETQPDSEQPDDHSASPKENTSSDGDFLGSKSSEAKAAPEAEAEDDLDPDVPLRLKKTSNFGLPFGEGPKPPRSGGDSPK